MVRRGNDAAFPRAHTLDRHGAGLSMQDMEDRVMGTGRWAGRPLASYAFKWLSDDLEGAYMPIEVHKFFM